MLTTYFNYADGGIYRKSSVEEAEPIVRTEINNKRPVIMDGYGTLTKKREKYKFWKYKEVPDDGHCWVCDGYKQITSTILVIYDFKTKDTKTVTRKVNKTFYHMNWGEDGYGMGNYDNNGWFSLDDIKIDDPDFEMNFQYNRGYLTGIKAK